MRASVSTEHLVQQIGVGRHQDLLQVARQPVGLAMTLASQPVDPAGPNAVSGK
jgi:hypothetical protein